MRLMVTGESTGSKPCTSGRGVGHSSSGIISSRSSGEMTGSADKELFARRAPMSEWPLAVTWAFTTFSRLKMFFNVC